MKEFCFKFFQNKVLFEYGFVMQRKQKDNSEQKTERKERMGVTKTTERAERTEGVGRTEITERTERSERGKRTKTIVRIERPA